MNEKIQTVCIDGVIYVRSYDVLPIISSMKTLVAVDYGYDSDICCKARSVIEQINEAELAR